MRSGQRDIFLDHNPQAFRVVLDFMRYDRILVPRTVCREVVILQMKQFGLPVGNITESELPAYEELMSKTTTKSGTEVMQYKMRSLVETVIKPVVIDLARHGNLHAYIYLTDVETKASTVASTIEDDGHVEWVCLSQGTHQGSSSSLVDDGGLGAVLSTMDDLTSTQRQRILSAIKKTREVEQLGVGDITSLPSISYLLQQGAFAILEAETMDACTCRQVSVERRDLTVRRENEYGLVESSSIVSIKIHVRLA
jgi:hypothetical protein